MISIVMAYFDRAAQFEQTLRSFQHFYADRLDDFELVVIDDHSPNQTECEDLLKRFPFNYQFEYIDHRRASRNPGNLMNQAARMAKGDILLLTFSECLHIGDVLGHAAKNWRSRSYLCYACRSFEQPTTFERALANPNESFSGYYQDANYCRYIYFAAAIGRGDFLSIGGIDPAFGEGDSYEDSDFALRLVRAGFTMVAVDQPQVIHQAHRRFRNDDQFNQNANLFFKRWGQGPGTFPPFIQGRP